MSADSLAPMFVLPTRRDEAWRYAPHRMLAELSFGPSNDDVAAVPADILERVPLLGGLRVVVINGIVDLGRSRLADGTGGVTVAQRAWKTGTDARHAVEVASRPADGYLLLNAEYGVDGAVIDIAAGVAVDTPIHVIDIASPDHAGNASCTRTSIRLGVGSSATVVESRIGVDSCGFGGSNVVTEVALDAGSVLDHIVVQDLPTSQVHLGRVDVDQAAGATFRSRSFNLGGAYGRIEYHVIMHGPDALADLAGLYDGAGEQVLDQQITVVHAARDCTSRQTFRGVLDDRSTGVFNGGIDVRRGADGTDASQSNHNLLLSTQAEANTQPRLEILADEVSCTHGATVGRLDDTALYYLRSRGIPADDARRLLINGFADEIVNEVRSEAVSAWISHRLGHDHD